MKFEIIEVTPTSKVQFDEKWCDDKTLFLFLAGTIEMGESEDWQKQFIEYLREADFDPFIYYIHRIVVFNPRRAEGFDESVLSLENQIKWELDHMMQAQYVIMNFLPNSKSPVSMLEFGLLIGSCPDKLHVICPPEFYRYTNIKETYDMFYHDVVHKQMYHNMEQFKSVFFPGTV
jgi:hypothetical protein